MSRLKVLLATAVAIPSLALAQSSIQPGLWETTTTPHDIVMPPGVPPQVAAMVRGKPETTRKCVSLEQAKNGPKELMATNPNCKYSRYDMANGKLNAVAICTAPNGNTETTYTANFTDSSFTMEGAMQVSGAMPMSMKFTGVGKFLGPCGQS